MRWLILAAASGLLSTTAVGYEPIPEPSPEGVSNLFPPPLIIQAPPAAPVLEQPRFTG